jgi:hypothetical protein
MATYADTAARLADGFETKENAETEREYLVIKRDSPVAETLKAMVFAADSAGLGWNFAYEAVRDALQWIADTDPDDFDESAHEFADSAVDFYTEDRIRWLASAPLAHMQLCDEAMDEFGDAGLSDTSLATIIGNGQYEAYRRAFAAVADHWPDDDDLEDGTETDAPMA